VPALGAAASTSALGALYRQVQQQAAMLSYVQVFYLLMFIAICALPLVFLMRMGTADAAAAEAAG
jgi:DHA2 family multidrug resistance protein